MKTMSKPCPNCGERKELSVPMGPYFEWKEGFRKIQDALPDLSTDDRERLMSGLHGECWDKWARPPKAS